MVKNNFLTALIICCLFPFIAFSQDVTVTAQIEGENIADKPLQGTITITHRKEDKIDPKSFVFEGKPLNPSFQKDVVLSPNSPLIISIYQFQIPGEKKGAHFLPEIKVKVGSQVYASTSTTYEVEGSSVINVNNVNNASNVNNVSNPNPPSESLGKVVLGLEPFIDGNNTIYPHQRIKVGYRYIYNYNFTLTKEEIPLLVADGFRKIGDKDFKETTRDGITTLEVSLVIEALKPGVYSFGPSVIQGKAYIEDESGRKQYSQSEYSAQAPVVTIKVDPFPERNKPASFQGAIGDFTMDLTLLSPAEVTVGDKMQLQITISGTGEIENVPMPEVCCQPGFSGFFKLSDLPPTEKVEDSKKMFVVELRPLSDSIHEIPPLEFSFFNPATITYSTVKSKPIPIKVIPLKGEPPAEEPQSPPAAKAEQAPAKPGAIEVEGNYQLTSTDLSNMSFGTWWVLLVLPFGALILFLQLNFKKQLEIQKTIVKTKDSRQLFDEALQANRGSPEFFNGLLNAFILRLYERGDIDRRMINPDELPKEGLPGEVRAFLAEIEEIRFAGKTGQPMDDIVKKARLLFSKLEENS